MKVTRLHLSNFRNYAEQSLELKPGLNVLRGKNAMGKTNLMEAIYVFGVGKSPRVTNDRDLITWEKDFAYIRAETEKRFSRHKVEIMIDRLGKKRIAIDSMPIGRIGELMGALNVVFFSPDEMKLVKESPVERRRFMDISLSQQNKAYFYTLQRYNKILDQRNKLLKETKDLATLDVWDVQLAEAGAKIIEFRYDFAERIKPLAKDAHAKLSEDAETLTVEYESHCRRDGNVAEQFLNLLRASREKDVKLTYTTVGPHRDDLKLTLNGVDTRKFASQGQQRTVALSLKLAEVEQFFSATGEYPVLLLDDVLSELDLPRQRALLDSVSHVQTVLTCTHFDHDVSAHVIDVENGKIISQS